MKPPAEPAGGKRADVERSEVKSYWNAHPIATDSVPFEKGTRESFEAIRARWMAGMNERRRAFLARCQGQRVLEVGCGIAMDGRWLAENGVDYQAVDLSRQSLALAAKHFELAGLRPRFANADATRLPFGDGRFGVVFSTGVLHHVPDTEAACRELVRVTAPGGTLRVMLYNRASYHYVLVGYFVVPLVWLLLHLPFGGRLAARLPAKLRHTFEICRRHGFDRRRVLDVSTDTSTAGESDFNPHSGFYTEAEMRRIFRDLGDFEFTRSDLKYFPLPFLRQPVEARWGFFLRMTARKPELPAQA